MLLTMFNKIIILVSIIYLNKGDPIASYVTTPECLDAAAKKAGVDLNLFYAEPYDCKPIEDTDQMKIFWQTYIWCSGHYFRDTCDPNHDIIYGKAYDEDDHSDAIACSEKVTSKSECGLQFVNCYVPKRAKCPSS